MIRARSIAELRRALGDARGADGPVVVHIEADRYAGVPNYESWWDVPVAEVSDGGGPQRPRGLRAGTPRPARSTWRPP